MEEAVVDGLSDRGSIPLSSIKFLVYFWLFYNNFYKEIGLTLYISYQNRPFQSNSDPKNWGQFLYYLRLDSCRREAFAIRQRRLFLFIRKILQPLQSPIRDRRLLVPVQYLQILLLVAMPVQSSHPEIERPVL